MRSAAAVGILVIVFVVLAYASFVVLGRNILADKYRLYYVDMQNAGGLTAGTEVQMAGVQVGQVDRVELVNARSAQFTLKILKNISIPRGSEAVITPNFIGVGVIPLSLVPGPIGNPMLPPGSRIPGHVAGPLDAVLPNGGKDLYDKLGKSMDAIQKLVADKKLQLDIKTLLETTSETLKKSQATMANFSLLASHANGILTENEGNLTAMLKSTRGTLEAVHDTAAAMANFIKGGKLQNGTNAMLTKALKIEGQASDLLTTLTLTVRDPKLRNNIQNTMQNVADASAKGPAIADNAQKITENMAQITESAKPLPETLNAVAQKASKLEDKLSDLLDKVNGFKAPSTKGLDQLTIEMDETRETDPGHWRTDVNATYPLSNGFITLGVYDAFEANDLNLQLGRNVGHGLDLRYGVYASKLGGGVDYKFTPKLSLRTDLWDINSPEFDARLRYDFGGGIIGWAGARKIFSGTAAEIGVGIRR